MLFLGLSASTSRPPDSSQSCFLTSRRRVPLSPTPAKAAIGPPSNRTHSTWLSESRRRSTSGSPRCFRLLTVSHHWNTSSRANLWCLLWRSRKRTKSCSYRSTCWPFPNDLSRFITIKECNKICIIKIFRHCQCLLAFWIFLPRFLFWPELLESLGLHF